MADRYRKLFDQGYDKLTWNKPMAADKFFKAVLADKPTHFLANFGHLVVLFNRKESKKVLAERQSVAETMLRHAPKAPSGSLGQLAMRYAANAIAHPIATGESDQERLLEGLRYAEIGARYDPDFDDETAPVTSNKHTLLVKLGRHEEAHELAFQVLETKPSYKWLQPVKRQAGFKRWRKARRAEQVEAIAAMVGEDLATALNVAMLRKVEQLNRNDKRAPMRRSAIARICMQATRGVSKATVPLPPSLQALLAYDAKLTIGSSPFFEDLLGPARRRRTMVSTTMTEVFRDSEIASAYTDLRRSAEADMPGLIELPLGSDQRVFMYAACPNRDGEYPIIRWDDEPCIWVSAGCLQDEICAWDNMASWEPLQGIEGATRRQRAAKRATAKWLKREPDQREPD